MCFSFFRLLRNRLRLYCNAASKLPLVCCRSQSLQYFSISSSLNRKLFRSPTRFTKKTIPKEDSLDSEDGDIDDEFAELDRFIERNIYTNEHHVLVIQPFIKWGPKKNTLTTPQLQLDEAVALVKTLNSWVVVDQVIISLSAFKDFSFFGPGQLEILKDRISSNPEITAVFISVNILKPAQQEFLIKEFGVPIFDRYTIVMHIFREHAVTKEAKLQIKLAEIPYLWSRLKSMDKGTLSYFGGGSNVIGTTWKGKQFHQDLMRKRQSKIEDEIKKLEKHRFNIRINRKRLEFPVVAVVGYTNAGKTSLIKALTGRSKLEPKNYLFATLDVTVHEGILPSSMKVLYVDTLGFLSDIPTNLFQSFLATLEDAKLADVIIHVRDISHPDTVAQNQNVKSTLELLGLPNELIEKMITVGNKIDLLKSDDLTKFRNQHMILISAEKLIGTDVLLQTVEKRILEVTERTEMVFKVRTGESEYIWLKENATVVEEIPDPKNSQYLLMKVIITNVAFEKFKHIFIKQYNKTR